MELFRALLEKMRDEPDSPEAKAAVAAGEKMLRPALDKAIESIERGDSPPAIAIMDADHPDLVKGAKH